MSSYLFIFESDARGGPSQDPLGDLLGRVDRSELERVVRELSGDAAIYIGDEPILLSTRYALSPQKNLACRYLCEEIQGYGYEPIEQLFILSVARASLTGIELTPGGDSMWVADVDGTIYLATAQEDWNDPHEVASLDGEIHDLELDSNGRLWAACGLPNGNLGAVRRSSDGGTTWETVYSAAQILSVYDIELAGDNAVAVGANGTVVLSAFGGEAWSVVDPLIFRFQTSYGAASSGPVHFWLVTVDGSLFETPNFGVDWIERDLTSGQLNSVDFFGPRHGVVVGNGVSFHTSDGGGTWNSVPVDADLRHVSMADSERVLAGGGGGELYYSTNGGASWTELTGICGSGEQVYRTTVSGSDRFWLAGGYDVRMVEGTDELDCAVYHYTDTIIGRNISFLHEGSEAPEKRILLTAHYDSYSSDYYECAPGADDNATGVSAVLQAARALRGASTGKSIEFVLFDGEEIGLRGSYYFASVLEEDVEYEAVINLDMLGYDHNIDRSLVIAGRDDNEPDSLIAEFIIGATADLGIGLYPEFAPGAALASDHRSFWSLGIPSVLLIEGYRDELTPRYHSCYDIADFIDYGYLELSAKVALGSVALLAGYIPDEPDTLSPAVARLRQNWPNPFNDATIIPYYLPRNAMTRLGLYDVQGREVARLFEGVRREGEHEYGWDGRGPGGEELASGIYFLRLESSAGTDVRKIVILR